MISKVTHVALLVRDQEEALAWYTEKLGFEVRSNEPFPGDPEHQWITIAPPGQEGLEIILQPPEWGPEQGGVEQREALIGQAPGFVLETTDCQKDYEELQAKGVTFTGPPMEMPWGISAVFFDLYGYMHNIVESREA
jgi:catechol 2,3-dioxygenase-like lactoylglutathione lyase family enzyme